MGECHQIFATGLLQQSSIDADAPMGKVAATLWLSGTADS